MAVESAPPEDGSEMAAFPSRFDWLLKNMQCPECGHSGFAPLAGRVSCERCEQTFDLVNGAVSFLDAGTRATFDIVDTENVSDHPYDSNAAAIIERCAAARGYVLDCGSGYKTRQFPNVIQMEIVPFPTVDVLATNQRLPFRDGAFDAVFSVDVLEHVNDPWRSAQELIRVLRPGGYIYVDIPFLQHEHGYPDHYFNATRSGLRQLFKGTEVLGHHVPASGSPIHTLHSILLAYRVCLPPELRPRFEALTVGDILAVDPTSWQTDRLVTELPEATRWVLASTTQALLRKPNAGGADRVETEITTSDLPGFAPVISPPVETTEPREPVRRSSRLHQSAGRALRRIHPQLPAKLRRLAPRGR